MEDYQFALNRSEKQSALWHKIQKHIDHLLQRERKRNDGDSDERATAFMRGKIALLKELQLLNETPDSEEE